MTRFQTATRRRAIVVVVLAAVVAAAAVASALGTTPGANGLITYGAEVDGHYQLFTIAPDGTGRKQLTHFTDGSDALNPDWSPDGKRIAFEHDFVYPHAGVYTMNANGDDVQTVTPDKQNLFEGSPAYSPDGSLIASPHEVHHDANTITPKDYGVIVVRRPDGTGLREVSPRIHLTVDDVPHLDDPNFSPDGKWITYVRINRDGALQALLRVRVDGTGLRQLTPYSWEVAIKHDWSPDGKLIVLTTNADFVRPNESANLVVIRPDGSGAKQLTHFKAGKRNAFAGSFSPNGKQIVFRLEQGDRYALAVIDRNGKNMRLITKLSPSKPRFIDWGTHHP